MQRYRSALLLLPWILFVCSVVLPSKTEAADTFQLGVKAARAGQLDRAIKLWTREIRMDPKSYAAYVNRGNAYLQSGHVLKGIEDWHEARKHAPIFAFGLYISDYIERASRNRRMLNYAKPLELDPDYVASIAMMGIAYLDLGRDRLAVKLYRKSIDLTRNPMLKNHLHHWVESITSHREE
jgi:tetratricopeptide (TPR) repeat protein